MPRPAPTATPTSSRSPGCWPRPPASAIEHTLHLSTGRHRDPPAARQGRGRARARSCRRLQATDAGFAAAAEALRTTDSVTKAATTTVELPEADGTPRTVTVSGIAKGVGMIHPMMATMLSIVLTDAAVEPEVLWGLLRPAAARTWDQLSVDGDTSTNDTVFVLASGASGAAPVRAGTDEAAIARRRDRGHRARPRPPAGRRRRGRRDADHGRPYGRPRRRRRPGRGPLGHLVQPGQGGGPRPRPELGPDRRRRRQRPAGRCARSSRPPGCPPDEATARAGTPAELDPDRLRISIAGHLVFDGAAGRPGRVRSRRGRARRWRPRRS